MPYHPTARGCVTGSLRGLAIVFLVAVFAAADLVRLGLNMLRGSRE